MQILGLPALHHPTRSKIRGEVSLFPSPAVWKLFRGIEQMRGWRTMGPERSGRSPVSNDLAWRPSPSTPSSQAQDYYTQRTRYPAIHCKQLKGGNGGGSHTAFGFSMPYCLFLSRTQIHATVALSMMTLTLLGSPGYFDCGFMFLEIT